MFLKFAQKSQLNPSFLFNSRFNLSPILPQLQSLRFRGKGSPGQSQGKRCKPRFYGMKVPPGTWVGERDIIVFQKELLYHPGLNVSFNHYVNPSDPNHVFL